MKEFFLALMKYVAKIPTKVILLSICIVSAILLFAPASILSFFALKNISDTNRHIFGLIFLVSTIILLLLFVEWSWHCFCSKMAYSGRDAKHRLDAVGDWNKSLIRQLYEQPSHSQKLPLQNANVQALLSENIIIHSPLGDALGFDCILQPWVVRYLDLHHDYVASIKKFDRPYKIELPFI
jgi:hypothetical protein